jgi:ketosteroid isomerase-like protein
MENSQQMDTKSVEVAMAFVAAVNTGSVDLLGVLMTKDHVFIDSDGAEYRGRSRMVPGWKEYFNLVPDYKIIVNEAFVAGATVMLTGEAAGTFAQDGLLKTENSWKVPAAWRAVVRGDKVAVWQLYVNPEPMKIILDRIRIHIPG